MGKYWAAGTDFVFQQEGAGCRTSKKALKWIKKYQIPLYRKHPNRTTCKWKQRCEEFYKGLVNHR